LPPRIARVLMLSRTLVLTVLGVKVRRIVIVVEDANDDSVESTDFRHPG